MSGLLQRVWQSLPPSQSDDPLSVGAPARPMAVAAIGFGVVEFSQQIGEPIRDILLYLKTRQGPQKARRAGRSELPSDFLLQGFRFVWHSAGHSLSKFWSIGKLFRI